MVSEAAQEIERFELASGGHVHAGLTTVTGLS
jgi:hypothetical protein